MSAQRDKGNTLERIIKAAEGEFAARGFEAANIENIAREARVTKQLVYHYFRTKDQLYRATLETVSEGMGILDDAQSYATLAPRDAIARLINTIIDDFISHPSYAALTLDQALHHGEHITQSSRFIPTMRATVDQVFKPVLERGMASGEFRQGLDPEITFWMLFHLATACFLNDVVMSEATSIDFTSQEGIERWRAASLDFALNALS
ncbi:MAG TPA: TetR/AcrR family transcriptional regulator [Porticoccaceae bacterium]|nr:TetR/AcrR family transcriptional regulator [Porticoccaceae bacterium]